MLDRLKTTLGWLCVAATLVLSSAGVRAVHAEDEQASRSVDPELVAERAANLAPVEDVPLAPAPEPQAKGLAALDRPGVNSAEIAPGVVVLNTRGYNYGPPPGDIDPAAVAVESRTQK